MFVQGDKHSPRLNCRLKYNGIIGSCLSDLACPQYIVAVCAEQFREIGAKHLIYVEIHDSQPACTGTISEFSIDILA